MEQEILEKDSTMRDYLRIVFSRKAVVATTVLLVMAGVFIGQQLKTPAYEAKVKMLILAKKQIESPYYKDISDYRATEITLTQSEIVKSNPVIERAVKRLRLNDVPPDYEKQFCTPLKAIFVDLREKLGALKLSKLQAGQRDAIRFREIVDSLKKKIKVEPVKNTDLFTITATDFSPEMAAKIANTVSRSYCIFDLEQQLAELKQLYGQKHLFVIRLQEDIDKMEANLKGDALSNIDAIGPASVKIIEQATVPITPKGLPSFLIMCAGLVLSLVLGIVLAFVFESFDSTFKSPEEIKDFLKYPLLGTIPRRKSFVAKALIFLKRLMNLLLMIFSTLLLLRILAEWMRLDAQNALIRSIYNSTEPLVLPLKAVLPFLPRGRSDIDGLIILCVLLALNIILSKILNKAAKEIIRSKVLIRKQSSARSSYIHAYQSLSEQIYLTMKGNGQKSALAASVLPCEGNSSVIANLGICLAEKSGHKVLLVDANFRKPTLYKKFKVDNNQGLADVLSGAASFNDALQHISENLSLLSAGRAVAEPVAVLGAGKMLDLLKEAENKFELILVDCANLKQYKDGVAISSYVDGVILMISEGRIRREVLEAGIAALKHNKVNFIGVIMNKRTFAIPKMIYDRA